MEEYYKMTSTAINSKDREERKQRHHTLSHQLQHQNTITQGGATYEKKKIDIKNVYNKSQFTTKLIFPYSLINRDINTIIEKKIKENIEGKCINEGYVKNNSVKLITYSSGLIKGSNIEFTTLIECFICNPVSGMLLNCIVKNVTKAGVRAESIDEDPSPYILFIARDHYYNNDYFNSLKENDNIIARVIAHRYELNDKYISIIAELLPQSYNKKL